MQPVILKRRLVLFAGGMVTDIWGVRAPPGLAGVDVRMKLRLVVMDFRICFRAELGSNHWVARFECGMSPGRVTFARLPLKGAGSSQSGAVCSLIFCPSTEPEAGTQPDEVGSGGLAVAGRAQTEEGVVLHSALPQVLAGARAVQPEHEGVLLLTPLVVILHYHEGQFALFKVHFGDLRPKE